MFGFVVAIVVSSFSLPLVSTLTCNMCIGATDPSQCIKTNTCLYAGEVCYTRKYNKNGQDLYDLGCSRTDMCSMSSSLTPGVVGKRSHDELLLNVTCCQTDFCNSKYKVTTKGQGFLILLPVLTEVSDDTAFCTIEILADRPCSATLEDGSTNKTTQLRLNFGINSFKMKEIFECCGNGKGDPFTLNGGYDRALYLTVSEPVVVYGKWELSFDDNHVHDRFLILPISMLGKEYFLVNFYRYSTGSNCIVGAFEDNTTVTIRYNTTDLIRKSSSGFENTTGTYIGINGSSFYNDSGAFGASVGEIMTMKYNLNRLDKLIITEAFLTGSVINSNNPIAVYMEERDMNTCNFQSNPECRYSKSNLMHSLPRASSLGMSFIVPALAPGLRKRIKLVSRIMNYRAHITINDGLSVKSYQLLQRYLDVDVGTGPVTIDSDSPLLVSILAFDDYISNSTAYGNSILIVPSITQYSNEHMIPISLNTVINETCYISLVLPYELQDNLLVNGLYIGSVKHSTDQILLRNKKYAIISFSPGNGLYKINHAKGIVKFGSFVFCSGTCSKNTCGLFESDPRTESLSANGYSGGMTFVH